MQLQQGNSSLIRNPQTTLAVICLFLSLLILYICLPVPTYAAVEGKWWFWRWKLMLKCRFVQLILEKKQSLRKYITLEIMWTENFSFSWINLSHVSSIYPPWQLISHYCQTLCFSTLKEGAKLQIFGLLNLIYLNGSLL